MFKYDLFSCGGINIKKVFDFSVWIVIIEYKDYLKIYRLGNNLENYRVYEIIWKEKI